MVCEQIQTAREEKLGISHWDVVEVLVIRIDLLSKQGRHLKTCSAAVTYYKVVTFC